MGFGGEDVAEGNPWHHEDITIRALAGPVWFGQSNLPAASTCPEAPQAIRDGPAYEAAGFSVEAACAVAWHADFIDAYLYNPVFWIQGGYDRFRAAMVGEPELLKLHFDDTFTTAGIRSTWQRYAAGTLIGLYWASLQNGGRGDVAAAHNVLGVSVHAVQDFYAHSNWVDDPDRRCATWLQTERAERDGMTVYSGAYELSEGVAPHHHGAYSPSCSLLRGEDFDTAFEALCTGLSPLQSVSICEGWRMCLSGNAIPISTWGDETANQVHTAQQGIALDTIWMARLHAETRRLLDAEGEFRPGKDGMHFPARQCLPIVNARRDEVCTADADQVFAGAKDLAIRATIEWIDYIGEAMAAMGPDQAAFWQRIKTTGSNQDQREASFEELNQLPYLFLSAGPYPVANPGVSGRPASLGANGWYLRLRIRTLDSVAAGTDAEIYAEVAGSGFTERQLLDRLPKEGILKGYDDFEEGDDDVYVVGPFATRPSSIALINDDAGVGDVVRAIWSDFTDSVDGAITDLRQTLISLIAGKADYVGTTTGFLSAKAVRPFLAKPFHDSRMVIDGGDQGIYQLTYRMRPTPWALDPQQTEQGWQAFEVQARAIKVLRESALDRGTGGDEPFVVFMVSPLNGLEDQSSSYTSTPFEDMQVQDERFLPRVTGSAKIVRIPPEGGVVISARGFESDSENAADREQLRLTFETALDEDERDAQGKFARALGGATGADWIVRSLEAFAFERDATPEAGPVLTVSALGEIEGGGESPAFTLDWSKVRPLVGDDFDITSWTADPVGPEVLEGEWHAENFECDDGIPGQTIEVTREGDNLTATKTLGDTCIETGEQTWTGTFTEGRIEGVLNLGKGEEPTPVVHDPGTPPPHPIAPLAAGWIVEWHGTPRGTLTGYVNLSLDGDWKHQAWFDQPTEDTRRTDYAIRGSLVVTDAQVSYESSSDHLCFPLGYEICDYDHRWRSTLTAVGPDELRGQWSAANMSGEEIWRRLKVPRPVEVQGWRPSGFSKFSGISDTAPFGERPIRFVFDPNNGFQRQLTYIDIHGEDLWGTHSIWMTPNPHVDLYQFPHAPGLYKCESDVMPDLTPNDILLCMQEQGVVKGIRIPMRVNREAAPGLYTLFFDGEPVQFIIEWEKPQRPMTLAVKSCSVMEEIDGPQPGLVFRRSALF